MIYVAPLTDGTSAHTRSTYSPESAFLAFALGDLGNGASVVSVAPNSVVVRHEGINYAYTGEVTEMAAIVKFAKTCQSAQFDSSYAQNEITVLRKITEAFGTPVQSLNRGARISAINRIIRDYAE